VGSRDRGPAPPSYRRPALSPVAVQRARNSPIALEPRSRRDLDVVYVPRARQHYDSNRIRFEPGWGAGPRTSAVERFVLRVSAVMLIVGAAGCMGLIYNEFRSAPQVAPPPVASLQAASPHVASSQIVEQPPPARTYAPLIASGKSDSLAASTHPRIDRAPPRAAPAKKDTVGSVAAAGRDRPAGRPAGAGVGAGSGAESAAAIVAREWSLFEPARPVGRDAAPRVTEARRTEPTRAEPTRTEPTRAEPIRTERIRTEPSKPAPARVAALESPSPQNPPPPVEARPRSAAEPARLAPPVAAPENPPQAHLRPATEPARVAVLESPPPQMAVRPRAATEPARLAALENPPPQIAVRPGPSPEALVPRVPSTSEAKTSLVEFATAPFPYEGKMPGSGRAFLDAGDPGHRGHTNFRGRVFWEQETFADNRVLLHIPPGFDPSRPAVMVVFFHGHGANLARDVRDRQKVPAQITASGANAVLVAPQFAFNAPDSSAGKFWEPGGFKRFVDEAAGQLARLQGDPRTEPAFATIPIVIVAYSGGFGPTLSVLDRGDVKSRVRGIVLLDALYSGMDKFAHWIAGNRSAFFVSSYTPHTQGRNADLERILADRAVSYGSELRRDHLAGMVTFLPAGTVSHRDFVTHAWADNPIEDILVRMDEIDPKVPIAGRPAIVPAAAAASMRN
jgi:hypothetical protein